MATDVLTRPNTAAELPKAAPGPSPWAAIGWLAGGAAVTFATSLIAADAVGLHHDLYLLVYFTVALAYLGWFAAKAGVAWRLLLRTNLWWSIGIGALVGIAVVRQVTSQGGTGHPKGSFFGFELVWRGLIYGSVDALVLAVFPALVSYLVLRGNRRGFARKAAFAGLVVVFSLIVSAAYHAGYSTYRGSTMSKPLTGTVLWDIPAVLTGNPAGAVVAHAAVHTSAVVHQYYGGDNHLLPPELTADYPERAAGAVGVLIAAGWLLLVSTVLILTRDRWLPPTRRPLLGLRTKPGRIALMFMHMPLRAYAHDQGHLLGHTFVQFTHVGRKSGKEYRAVAMVLGFDDATSEAVICAAWDTDWLRNLREHPATNVKIDRLSFTPVQRFLTEDEAYDVVGKFRAAHPGRVRLVTRILGWGSLQDEAQLREFTRAHPFIAFRPQFSD